MCVLSIHVIQRGLDKQGLMYYYAPFVFHPTAGYCGIVLQYFQAAVIHNITWYFDVSSDALHKC